MRRVFADAVYWIALANPRDQWYQSAVRAEASLAGAQIVTTEEVLSELLAAVASGGEHLRKQAVRMVRAVIDEPTVEVRPQTHDSFASGLELYEARADKQYSLTDCISMNACRELGISEILTSDRHFAQEGFTLLMSR